MKKQFDRFTFTDLIAQGAGGSLYSGEEKLPGGVVRPVLVKVLPAFSRSDPNGEARFVEEVRVLAALAAQPHVVTFYGMGITDATPWIATEFISLTVESLMGQSPAEPGVVARMIEHVALGLAALHSLQPVRLHNRLQPSNLLVCEGGRHFKVTEFGLAAPPTAEPMLSSDSVRYAAPELISGDSGRPGPSTDLYALGHIAYELALGAKLHRQQFPAVADGSTDLHSVNPARWQAWHHSAPTVAAPAHEVVRGFPQRLSEIIVKLIAKPVVSRYASAMDVVNEIEQAMTGSAAAIDPGPSAPAIGAASAAPVGSASFTGRQPAAPPQRVAVAVSAPSAAPLRPAVAAAAAGGQKYFVRLRDQMSGPFDLPTLQQLARQGKLSRLHQVSLDQRAWKSASSVEGLF